MKTIKQSRAMLAVGLLGAFAAQSALACKAPATPKSMPDGRSAHMTVMLEAKRDVEQYVQHVSAYASCENDALKLQEAVAQQKVVMARFNAEVRAFNAANPLISAAR